MAKCLLLSYSKESGCRWAVLDGDQGAIDVCHVSGSIGVSVFFVSSNEG